jgi:hypothetical protein
VISSFSQSLLKILSLKGDVSLLKGLSYISCIFGISPKDIFEEGHKVATNVDIIVNKYFLGVFL